MTTNTEAEILLGLAAALRQAADACEERTGPIRSDRLEAALGRVQALQSALIRIKMLDVRKVVIASLDQQGGITRDSGIQFDPYSTDVLKKLSE